MNFSASTVCLELMVTLPASSCSAPPKDHKRARMAMLVSSSCERPMPHGWPFLSLIFLAPARRSSHVSGPFGIACFGPPVFVPVARIGSVRIREGKILFRLRVVSGLVRQIDLLAVLLFHFLVDMGHVNDLLFISGRRGEEHEDVMALFRLRFRSAHGC